MTTPPPSSPQDNHLWKSQFRQQISTHQPNDFSLQSSSHSNGKMMLGKTTSCPVTQGELPPLVGVPHTQDKSRLNYHSTTPDSTAIQTLHHGTAESELPPGAGGGSPLIHRRLKFMVRQCSDSELLKNHRKQNFPSSGSVAASPAPHPPDTSPRSRNSSSGSNSPQVFRKPSLLNPAVVGTSRASRSLDGSPMIVRRIRGGTKHQSGQESPTPTGNEPSSGKTRRTRPFSFGSFTDVLQHVANTGEASPRSGGSPYVTRRTVSLRGGTLMPSSRPDTPATESDPKKSHHHSSSSGERNGVDDSDAASVAPEDSLDQEGIIHLRRRLRHDSGSQHAQRNSIGHIDYNRNLPKQPACDDQESDHEVDDDTNFPSNLYDIQERRESVLSIEACQEIARRVANEVVNAEKNDSDENDVTNADHTTKKKNATPEYRKLPLSTDVRVTCWLKGIQDPTEVAPPKFDRILPEIL